MLLEFIRLLDVWSSQVHTVARDSEGCDQFGTYGRLRLRIGLSQLRRGGILAGNVSAPACVMTALHNRSKLGRIYSTTA